MCRDGFLSIRWTIDWSWELLATVFVAPPRRYDHRAKSVGREPQSVIVSLPEAATEPDR